MNPVVWGELWSAMKENYLAGNEKWVETTEEMYDEQLNVLPPEEWEHGSFLVGEAWNHNSNNESVYACFMRFDGRYYARYLTRRQWRNTFKKARTINPENCEMVA